MRLKLMAIIAILLIMAGSGKLALAQYPDVTGSPAQVCDATDNLALYFEGEGVTLNHDQCVVIVNFFEAANSASPSAVHKLAVAECKFEQALGFYLEGGTNFGECVSFYEQEFNSEDDASATWPLHLPLHPSPRTAIARSELPLSSGRSA